MPSSRLTRACGAAHVAAHVRNAVVQGGPEREAGAGVAGPPQPAFTLATYVHLLPDDLPETPFGGPAVTEARRDLRPDREVAAAGTGGLQRDPGSARSVVASANHHGAKYQNQV